MTASTSPFDIVVIGSSWGGLHAVGTVLHDLDPANGLMVVVAQHRRPEDSPLADLLSQRGGWTVCESEDKERLSPGQVYLAPPGYHLLVEGETLALSTEGPVNHSRPSIDVLFESAADAWGERLIGLVLTGASADGAAGLDRIKRRGGYTIVQDPATAERRTMPEAAIAIGPHRILPLDEIGAAINDLCTAGADR